MRIDPEAVYLELTPSALIFNLTTSAERHAPAVVLRWKEDRKWQRRSFFGSDHNGETLGEILCNIGKWIDAQGGLDAALTEAYALGKA
jgi:hypothetical protein